MTNTPINKDNKAISSFSVAINLYMERKGITQKELMVKANLPKTTVSRICRGKNDKGDGYHPTPRMVATLCVALGLNKAEKDALFEIAFPEIYLLDEILDKKMDLLEANAVFLKHKLKLLGSPE